MANKTCDDLHILFPEMPECCKDCIPAHADRGHANAVTRNGWDLCECSYGFLESLNVEDCIDAIRHGKMNVGNPMSEFEYDRMKARKDRLIEDEKQRYFEEGYDQCFREVIDEIKAWNHPDTKSFIMWLSKTFKSSAAKL